MRLSGIYLFIYGEDVYQTIKFNSVHKEINHNSNNFYHHLTGGGGNIFRWSLYVVATDTASTTTATDCGCGGYLPAICRVAAVITSLSLMRSRVAALTEVNATVGLVQHTVAAGHGVVREDVVAAVVVAVANATNSLRPLSSPPPPRHRHQQTPLPVINQTTAATGNNRVDNQAQSLGTVMVLMVVTVAVLGTVGLLTCVLHHYNQQYNPAVHCLSSGPHQRLSTPLPPPPPSPQLTSTTASTSSTPPTFGTTSSQAMLTMRSNNGLTREHNRQVRLHSVRTDLELDLPPQIHLPDGEEYPYGSMAKIHLRNSEQEREIYQKCIRGPPNRTIWPSAPECGSKLSHPHRSSSATGLTSLSGSSSEIDSVLRCNSTNSRCLSKTTSGFPPVVDDIQSLSSLTMVPCLSHVDKQTLSQ
ncbi:uncharacterized protein LOC126901795 [Daktulosphaira vitifoliae]|uniref:uncharacterized protein LOC126901795 n=1 Tax=Daktulosphaira vitifoliae TaxID=58002 RepID=UPI0021AAA189|nr:uncharacterized protein LOC126901795 [Daktulosphaira vitifoliae]XP_050534516.1 uncharacterized protein LOC126901795 [Daktulosphaira vitifoliae]XP_050534517.1 uncharacterized protein LOC126901795 [Daktulosphaira vitifoliae]